MSGKQSRFILHVEKFMDELRLFPESSSNNAYIAASAGRDSIALIHTVADIMKRRGARPPHILHINHGTRVENADEQRLVKDIAKQLDLPFHFVNLQGELERVESDFEFTARKLRYDFFHSHMKAGDCLYTAHHVDDSFEWSLLQQFKSGSMTPTLGIPVRNGSVYRPFMSVTRSNINRYILEEGLSFCEDPTNRDIDYDRNFIRHMIVPRIRRRFPSYLKHYVRRSNQLAQRLGKSAFNLIPAKDLLHLQDQKFDGFVSSAGGSDFRSMQDEITKAIFRHSHAQRGEIREQMNKLFEAAIAHKRGPLSFSGNVNVHMMPGNLLVLNRESEVYFHDRDQQLYEKIQGMDSERLKKFALNMNFKQFDEFFAQQLKDLGGRLGEFPFWVMILNLVPRDSRIPSQKRIHPLWPATTNELLRMSVSFQSLVNLHRLWKRAKSLRKRSLLFVPIWFIN